MASEAQSSFDYGSHQVKFRVRCWISEILPSYAGQATTVESVDHLSDTVCDVPCFTCMSEGRAYGCLVEANLHENEPRTFASPHFPVIHEQLKHSPRWLPPSRLWEHDNRASDQPSPKNVVLGPDLYLSVTLHIYGNPHFQISNVIHGHLSLHRR